MKSPTHTIGTQVRNGWFSYRWSQIFDAGSIVSSHIVVHLPLFLLCNSVTACQLKARRASPSDSISPFAPPPINEVTAEIAKEKPCGEAAPPADDLCAAKHGFTRCAAVVFAPHVETSAGIMIPDDYIKQLADAAHAVGQCMCFM